MNIDYIGPASLGGQPSVLLVSVHRGVGDRLIVRVEDDGWGPLPGDDRRPTPSLCLKTAWMGCRSLTALDSLEAEVEALGGALSIGPSRLGGLALVIRLPPDGSEEELMEIIGGQVRALARRMQGLEIEHVRGPGKASWFLRLHAVTATDIHLRA